MKTKNILMSILLVVGSIAAKAATGYPPELALVSQPVMVYNYNSITVYYDVENIGDYTYRGNVYLYLDPDYGYYYADKYVRVSPGSIKRIAINIPARRIDRGISFTIMPYYELDDELYSFTTFEYFEPLSFHWRGPRNERWVVISAPPRIRIYTRPGHYRYYYDGYRPPMPPPGGPGHGPGTPPPPMNPKHHTYGYHSNNGGYPATHEVNPPAPSSNEPAPSGTAPSATVRPKANGGSMSSGGNHSSDNGGNTPPPATNNNGGRTPSSGSMSRPSGTNSGTSTGSASSSRPSSGTSGVSRPKSSNNGPSTRPTTNGSGVSRPNSSSRPSGSSRVGGSSSSTRSSGTSTGSSSTRSSSSSSSSSRNSSSSGSNSSSSSRSGSGATRR